MPMTYDNDIKNSCTVQPHCTPLGKNDRKEVLCHSFLVLDLGLMPATVSGSNGSPDSATQAVRQKSL